MRGHGEENQHTWEQAQITSQKGRRFNWVYDKPLKPPPMRTNKTFYASGLRLVPGKSESCEPEAPHVDASEHHILGRRISTLFEKCPKSEDEDSCQAPQHSQERGRRVAPPPTEGRSGKPKKFPPVGPPPSPSKPFIPYWARY